MTGRRGEQHERQQSVVDGRRRTEGGEAPRWQGAPTGNTACA
jgi:hypothetical protein